MLTCLVVRYHRKDTTFVELCLVRINSQSPRWEGYLTTHQAVSWVSGMTIRVIPLWFFWAGRIRRKCLPRPDMSARIRNNIKVHEIWNLEHKMCTTHNMLWTRRQTNKYSPHNIEHLAISKRPVMKDAPPLQIHLTSISQALDSNGSSFIIPSPRVMEESSISILNHWPPRVQYIN